MKLQTRLGLAAIAVVGLVSIGISYSALLTAEESERNRLIESVDAVMAETRTAADPVTSALLAADVSPVPLAVGLVIDETDLTIMNSSTLVLEPLMTAQQLLAGESDTVEVTGPHHYFARTFYLSEGQYLLVAVDVTSVDRNTEQNRAQFAWWTIGGVLIGAVIIVWLIRREMKVVERLIEAADEISKGETQVIVAEGRAATELRQLADSLRRMVSTLNRSVEVERESKLKMRRFLGDASHELRTPLTVVKGYSEMLATNPDLPADQRQRAVERVRAETSRMEQLIQDLLLLTELNSDTTRDLESVDFGQLVVDATEDLRVLDPGRPIAVKLTNQVFVEGSAKELRQLLSNVFGNIHRHTPPLAPVSVRLIREGSLARLTIEDGGPGLSAEAYQAGIGEFQRFDPSRSRDTGGSGLGMSIMAAIVVRHGGTIELAQSPLGGLSVSVGLPLLITDR